MSSFERDPKKRRVKPVESQAALLDFDLGESSDDSDFRIEDHAGEESDDYDDSIDSNDNDNDQSSEIESDAASEEDQTKKVKVQCGKLSVAAVIQEAKNRQNEIKAQFSDEQSSAAILAASKSFICCGCLGDRSDDINEIVECDSCGVTVHEACYGISDSVSLASAESDCPTEPWFCEACRAGVVDPHCELCPNTGGIFKETDVGKWVHLVCALYVPGVAFGEVDHLAGVTLFEMPYSRWGAKTCTLCEDERYSRTGVCVACDAGMCRTYFHVTCAQREGYLSEAHSEEVDQADPFYAQCKLHSDKTIVRRRKTNWLALQLRMRQRKLTRGAEGFENTPEQIRIQRKLNRSRQKFLSNKTMKSPPWVPTQKMPRLLTTSASACRKLLKKAELMGIDTLALEMQEAQVAALTDIRKKWHIPPAFSVEFIAYYLDRNDRLRSMKSGLEELLDVNAKLLEVQQELRSKYDKLIKENSEGSRINVTLKQTLHKYHSAILSACPTKLLPSIDEIGIKPATPPVPSRIMPQGTQHPQEAAPPPVMAVPTAAALKMGLGYPLNNFKQGRLDSSRMVLSSHQNIAASITDNRQDPMLLNECGICRQRRDQHLLAKCDTCHLYYHLNCLNPPLTRLPKKSKLYGWQCSECDRTSESEPDVNNQGTRRSRQRNSEECLKVKIKPVVEDPHQHLEGQPQPTTIYQIASVTNENEPQLQENPISRSNKKRRREKHRNRYSPDEIGSSKEHKRKRKKKDLEMESPNTNPVVPAHPRITIKLKSIPLPEGERASPSQPQCFYVPKEEDNGMPTSVSLKQQQRASFTAMTPPMAPPPRISIKKTKTPDVLTKCDVCQGDGTAANLVRCDDCQKIYHFTCLEPPVKKSPKRRGYSWHCADCDPTDIEST